MSDNIVSLERKTYTAKQFSVCINGNTFLISGTLDGFIDFALPKGGTYQLTLDEARILVASLNSAVEDVFKNCLYDRDALLEKSHDR